MGVECVDGFQSPGLAPLAFCFAPDNGFPIGRNDHAHHLPVPPGCQRVPKHKEKRSLDGMFMRSCFDVNTCLKEQISRAKYPRVDQWHRSHDGTARDHGHVPQYGQDHRFCCSQ